jgi:hypothetical protein
VYTALWRNTQVVVKQVQDDTNPEAIREFLKEVNHMKKLRPHPNVKKEMPH